MNAVLNAASEASCDLQIPRVCPLEPWLLLGTGHRSLKFVHEPPMRARFGRRPMAAPLGTGTHAGTNRSDRSKL